MQTALYVALSMLLLAGCASTRTAEPEVVEVERSEVPVDLSGDWNDVDADLVAIEVVGECLEAPWIGRWKESHGKNPVVRLHPIRNRTANYIDYRYFTKQIEKAFVQSGKVDVVTALEEMDTEDTSGEETPARPNELGADFVLTGHLLSVEDRMGTQEARAYLATIEIIEVETSRKVYVGEKRIKKLIEHRPE